MAQNGKYQSSPLHVTELHPIKENQTRSNHSDYQIDPVQPNPSVQEQDSASSRSEPVGALFIFKVGDASHAATPSLGQKKSRKYRGFQPEEQDCLHS